MAEGTDELVRSAVAGDRVALEGLLRRHGPEVQAGLQIGREWQGLIEAEDVMQVTYFEAFHHITQLDGDPSAFPTWLRRIAENNLRDAIRALERDKRPHPEDRLHPPAGQDSVVWLHELVAGTGTTPSGQAGRAELRTMLEAEIAKLPATYATVLRAVYLEEKTVADVAAQLGRTKGAVHLLRLRALDRLREQLGSASNYL